VCTHKREFSNEVYHAHNPRFVCIFGDVVAVVEAQRLGDRKRDACDVKLSKSGDLFAIASKERAIDIYSRVGSARKESKFRRCAILKGHAVDHAAQNPACLDCPKLLDLCSSQIFYVALTREIFPKGF
jgi:hypothetical protein